MTGSQGLCESGSTCSWVWVSFLDDENVLELGYGDGDGCAVVSFKTMCVSMAEHAFFISDIFISSQLL